MKKILISSFISIFLTISISLRAGLTQTGVSYLNQVISGPTGPKADKNLIVIFVNTGVYYSIIQEVNQYATDIRTDGYQTVIEIVSGGTPDDLRNELKTWLTHGLIGAVYVGEDLPVPLFKIIEESNEEIFPCHLFYEDLDGEWIDVDDDGIFEMHHGGSGNKDPEIWFSLINFSSLDTQLGSEVNHLINYFSRNHSWRVSWPLYKKNQRRALAYPDDAIYNTDYPYINAKPELTDLYSGQVDVIQKPNPTTKADYLAKLQKNYEFVHVMSHGNPQSQSFSESDGTYQLVTAQDILGNNLNTYFYDLVGCNLLDYIDGVNNIGEAYLAGNGLVVWGTSKLGGGFQSNPLKYLVKKGNTFGDAWYSAWFDNSLDNFCKKSEAPFDEYFACRHSGDYARIPMGDPTIRMSDAPRYMPWLPILLEND